LALTLRLADDASAATPKWAGSFINGEVDWTDREALVAVAERGEVEAGTGTATDDDGADVDSVEGGEEI